MSIRLVTPELLRAWPLPELAAKSDKEARGRVLVVGGGAEMPGAVVLAGLGALRAGAGKLQVAAAPPANLVVAAGLPEARVLLAPGTAAGDLTEAAADVLAPFAERAGAVVIGPGLPDEPVAAVLAETLAARAPEAAFVLDAAALTGLTEGHDLSPAAGRLVLTPHAGEMASLLGEAKEVIESEPDGYARMAAARFSAVVALKGRATSIASPDGVVWRFEGGAVGLGTCGSGDVLAGVIGGLLARGCPPAQAAVWGVALHGEAGRVLSEEVGPLGFLAREIPAEIPAAMARLGG